MTISNASNADKKELPPAVPWKMTNGKRIDVSVF